MCHLKLISSDIQRTKKHAEDVDISIVLDEVGDPGMPIEQDAHMAEVAR
jgi:hypothetical protein